MTFLPRLRLIYEMSLIMNGCNGSQQIPGDRLSAVGTDGNLRVRPLSCTLHRGTMPSYPRLRPNNLHHARLQPRALMSVRGYVPSISIGCRQDVPANAAMLDTDWMSVGTCYVERRQRLDCRRIRLVRLTEAMNERFRHDDNRR